MCVCVCVLRARIYIYIYLSCLEIAPQTSPRPQGNTIFETTQTHNWPIFVIPSLSLVLNKAQVRKFELK